jgi:DNA-binding MarR family transcriptional regulator
LLVSRLEAGGYVKRTRSRRDRRKIEVDITPAGRKIARSSPDAPLERVLAALEDLSPSDLRGLLAGLENLLKGMRVSATDAPPLFEPASGGEARRRR